MNTSKGLATPSKTAIKQEVFGSVTQIIGPVLDVSFPPNSMPTILNALKISGKNSQGKKVSVICEVQQLLGDNSVRAISMTGTRKTAIFQRSTRRR